MKKSLCILICFAVVLTACAVGFSVFAGTDALTVVSGPKKSYYLVANEGIDVTGTKLNVKIDGREGSVELTQNKWDGNLAAAAPTTTTTVETTVEETTSAEEATSGEETTSGEVTTAVETTTETTTEEESTDSDLPHLTVYQSKVKVYYDKPLTPGKNKVLFQYEGKTAECNVYYDASPVKSISVTKSPDKTSYFYGYDNDKEIELKGLEITVTYKDFGDGEKTYVYKYNDEKSLMFMGYKFDIRFAYQEFRIGDNPIIVTYLGKESQFVLKYEQIYPGDVNDDGLVNAADIVRLSRMVINNETLDYNPLTTDLNQDGNIDQDDLLELQNLLTLPDDRGEFDWVFDAQLLSYMVSADGYFYTNDDPWQRNFGFNALYDYATPYTFMYYDTFRVFFDYGEYKEGELDGVEAGTPKKWMIQPWKGQYGMVLYGAELGVYTKPATRVTPHYDCANDEDRLLMKMTVYKDEKEAFSMPYKEYWWITGFKPGALINYTDMSKPHSQLTIDFTLDFPTNEMAQLFAAGLEERGFTRASFIDTENFRKVDVYTISGNSVRLLWRNVVGTPGQTNVPNAN